jgi:hypothetical protein
MREAVTVSKGGRDHREESGPTSKLINLTSSVSFASPERDTLLSPLTNGPIRIGFPGIKNLPFRNI